MGGFGITADSPYFFDYGGLCGRAFSGQPARNVFLPASDTLYYDTIALNGSAFSGKVYQII